MINQKDKEMQEYIHQQVMKVLEGKNLAFSNVARPKPEKASSATSASWKKEETPKPSAATQGSWDSTDTPGGVSSIAKEKWTPQAIAYAVTKVLMENGIGTASPAFANKPLPKPTTISSSTQPAWKKDDEEPVRKPAAGTQGAWDTTDSPGGVSSKAKEVWTPEAIAYAVTKVLKQNGIEIKGEPTAEFANMPVEKPTTISSSTQPAWKKEPEERKISASTQVVWKKDEPRKPSASTQAIWQ